MPAQCNARPDAAAAAACITWQQKMLVCPGWQSMHAVPSTRQHTKINFPGASLGRMLTRPRRRPPPAGGRAPRAAVDRRSCRVSTAAATGPAR